ncbi:DUF6233 domain-containing protein [Streptomyces atratus]|uniref:DUF6233 domain-containing protein n=2 Tax=Streptomyces atratus TaxID=1893 RepID=UPI002AC346E1|nr:DUF6233 domain-containing protein [Streptomyces atratus]
MGPHDRLPPYGGWLSRPLPRHSGIVPGLEQDVRRMSGDLGDCPDFTETAPPGCAISCGRQKTRFVGLRFRRSRSGQRKGRVRAEQSWKIQPQRSGETALLHCGGCTVYNAAFGFLNREDALIALEAPPIVRNTSR